MPDEKPAGFLARMWDRADSSVLIHDVVYVILALLIGGALIVWLAFDIKRDNDLSTWGNTAVWILAIAAGSKTINDLKMPFTGGPK